MISNEVDDWSRGRNEEALLADGFEDAFLGMCEVFGRPPLATYDRDKCIEIIIESSESSGLTDEEAYDEAEEFFEFNVAGSWVGDNTPVYMTLHGDDE